MAGILKIKVVMRDIKPEIWREFLVESDTTFEMLHKIIQLTFNWTNSHLYNFEVDRQYFGPKLEGLENEDIHDVTPMTEFLFAKGQKALYTYDMGDRWEHDIEVLEVMPKEKGKEYPVCLGGERNVPPEDCGGIPGFEKIQKALEAKAKGKKYNRSVLKGVSKYDPNFFDLDEVNAFILDPDSILFDPQVD